MMDLSCESASLVPKPPKPAVAILACTVCAWILTLATGGTAIYTAWSLSSEALVQWSFAAVEVVMTVMLIVTTDEAGRQQNLLIWCFFSALFAISLWCSATALEFSATSHQHGLSHADTVRWSAAFFLDSLRAGCVWLGQSIKARIEAEARQKEREAEQRERTSRLFENQIPTSWEAENLIPETQEVEKPKFLNDLAPGTKVTQNTFKQRMAVGQPKAKAMYQAAKNQGWIVKADENRWEVA